MATNVFHIGGFHPDLHMVWSQKAQAPVFVGQASGASLGAGAAAEQQKEQDKQRRSHRFFSWDLSAWRIRPRLAGALTKTTSSTLPPRPAAAFQLADRWT